MSRTTGTTHVNHSTPSTKHEAKPRAAPGAHTTASKQSARVPAVLREFDYMPTFARDHLDDKRSIASDAPSQIHILHANAKSPDPLPVPLRTREPPVVSASPEGLSPEGSDTLTSDSEDDSDFPPQYPPNYQEDEAKYSGQTTPKGLSTIHEKPIDGANGATETSRPPLVRRRSSLKKCNSTDRLSVASQTKSVAWAMDKDWIDEMAKYMSATNDAEVLGKL